jgi:hypothetical protein
MRGDYSIQRYRSSDTRYKFPRESGFDRPAAYAMGVAASRSRFVDTRRTNEGVNSTVMGEAASRGFVDTRRQHDGVNSRQREVAGTRAFPSDRAGERDQNINLESHMQALV